MSFGRARYLLLSSCCPPNPYADPVSSSFPWCPPAVLWPNPVSPLAHYWALLGHNSRGRAVRSFFTALTVVQRFKFDIILFPKHCLKQLLEAVGPRF